MKCNIVFMIIFLVTASCSKQKDNAIKEEVLKEKGEVFYHIFQRSFFDTNNDLHGDLNGIVEKIDYFKKLGVTSLLFTPLYESIYYHNYFADDFMSIDSEFGTIDDYFNMVKTLHRNDLKFYMDMEIHYVTKNHVWFKNSFNNPNSEYSNHVIYNGKGNTDPESMIFNLNRLESFDGKSIDITTVDLYNEDVKMYFYNLFTYWVDPNRDGDFSDGVDGFRIDHMMDDLDWKGIRTNLFVDFWAPLFTHLKSINPDLKIFGEQANWKDLGQEYFTKGKVDMMFAFGLREGILSQNKEILENKMDSLIKFTPKDKDQILFIENHDTPRFSSLVGNNIDMMKLGGFLMFSNRGVPSIYYGQELGMMGVGGFGRFGSTDGNDIPMREAFEWHKSVEGLGMSLWYKNSGPWWDETSLRNNDGVSFEEQKDNPESLFNFYRKLIKLRKENSAISSGDQVILQNENPNILTFLRFNEDQVLIMALNLSDKKQSTFVDWDDILPKNDKEFRAFLLNNGGSIISENKKHKITLAGKGFFTCEIK
ncbi:MAG: alpha-amylase family glycosyl hydrolase [Winogradskyella sp.]